MSVPVITEQFGTLRGAVRLALSYGELALGLSAQCKPEAMAVQRLVFVCHGNICRSAYAHGLAAAAGANVASFGLSTSTGKRAHRPVIELAAARGLDLSGHRSTDVADFVPQQGDLLLAMETRHLRKFASDRDLANLPRMLLGNFAPFAVPHLHDPYELDASYMAVCLTRIERAVEGLLRRYPAAISA